MTVTLVLGVPPAFGGGLGHLHGALCPLQWHSLAATRVYGSLA